MYFVVANFEQCSLRTTQLQHNQITFYLLVGYNFTQYVTLHNNQSIINQIDIVISCLLVLVQKFTDQDIHF